jgi:hypothetical protein
MKKILLYFKLSLFFSLNAQNIETKNGLRNAATCYGYLMGQEYSLNNIKNEYPYLASEVKLAELLFKISFGEAKNNLESLIIKNYSEDFLNKFKNEINKEFKNINIGEIESAESAILFIDEVKSRSKGNIVSPIKEYLLTYAFYNNPEDEYTQGFIQIFNCKDHPKSKGTDWKFKVPISWVAKEADRPNIIKKFINEGGFGNDMISVMVEDLKKKEKMTTQEVDAFFTEKASKELIPKGGKFIRFNRMTIDGLKGGLLEFELTSTTLDLKAISRAYCYMFIFKNQLYTLYGSTVSEISSYNPIQAERFSKLFKLVANSIVVNNQYTK